MGRPGSGGGISTAVPRRYRRFVDEAALKSGLPEKVVAAQIDTESGWNPRAVSPTGAEGIAQFEPGTWSAYNDIRGATPFQVGPAFQAYGRYMGSLLREFHGNIRDALAAYNAGPGNLQAGYGYADEILGAAGLPGSARDIPYRNPLRGVQNLQPERVDMGVDYAGEGPVYALGPGVITAAGHAWRGAVGAPVPGTWITEHITQGPLAGRDVYVAEDIFDVKVRPGQRVTSGTELGTLRGGLETGFAAPGSAGLHGETLAASLHEQAVGGDPGAQPTAVGSAYSKILRAVGAPAGIESGQPVGEPPPWLAGILAGIDRAFGGTGAAGAGAAGGLSGIGGTLGSIAQTLTDVEHAIAWFFVPNHWVRIFAGIFGTGFVIAGIGMMARTGRAYSVNVPMVGSVPTYAGGEIAPAIGIALVTIGAILLFIAFHNLPAEVTNFPTLVSHLQQQVQSGGQG